LNLRDEPHGHGSLRPSFREALSRREQCAGPS
jgi:hypothetical protein